MYYADGGAFCSPRRHPEPRLMPEIDLAFIARQLDRVLLEQADARDRDTVGRAIPARIETRIGSLQSELDALTREVRAPCEPARSGR
jgi:hypothetical protein